MNIILQVKGGAVLGWILGWFLHDTWRDTITLEEDGESRCSEGKQRKEDRGFYHQRKSRRGEGRGGSEEPERDG